MEKKLRVLVVEDSEDDALLLARELRRSGYDPILKRVDTAESMAEALDAGQWDIVLADYHLPLFSGLEALRIVKERDLELPLIVVSGVIGEEVAVAAMKVGAHDYIMKENLAKLGPAIERALREASNRRERKNSKINCARPKRWKPLAFLRVELPMISTTSLLQSLGTAVSYSR